MTKKLTQALKLILVAFSLYLCYMQAQNNNTAMVIYWIVVAVYWLFNFLSGLPAKK